VKKYFFLILLVIFLIAFGFFYFHYFTTQSRGASVCIKEKCFNVELATTPAQQEQGLMYRTSLDNDKGMLFVFDKEGIYPFWMKNTLMPLDMIWIDSSNKVVFIAENVQPCKTQECPSITPGANAKYVLEMNGNISKGMGLAVGDTLDINFVVK